ncbi:DeoR/GlpR family DNA-binding transcription regulator [Lysinibacter cavernae]|uniref:DeoR/GlpR family transcriptional regulator of sugar metabolism n=1 Tax=Lysinibacter cavernae TaxID=1640652 RepID=A0A7X5TU94_9MICO|nr:DeoR/GlpR family DNA-binding transcription regulator [Lysinibacter cavernae]NIH55045.1 DeoR/GlpR family transcriptional regulator of sugar metabolism [Lysinibacter cavernae]
MRADDTNEAIPAGAEHVRGLGRRKAARLAYVTDLLNNEDFVSVDDLADMLDVSRMTVHRDLDELQHKGVLRKMRGGATAHRSAKYESDLLFRARLLTDEKKAIAKEASTLIAQGDVVLVDASTTTYEMFPYLAESVPLTVITNFWLAIQELAEVPDINIIALGGDYVPQYRAFLGAVCEHALDELYADILFASTSAMQGSSLYHQDQRVVSVKRAMLQSARTRVLLMDHTKFGHGSLHRLGTLEEFTHIVVDDRVSTADLNYLRDADIEVLVATV